MKMVRKGSAKKFAAMLCMCCVTLGLLTPQAQAKSSSISLGNLDEYAGEYLVGENVLDALSDAASSRGKIAEDTFKEIIDHYVDRYKETGSADDRVGLEFIQLFFDDCFVYNENGSIVYEPVNKDLKMNKLDWDNLQYRDDGEIRYVKDGKSRAYKGIDVSAHQMDIDWERVADDGVDFAMIRLGNRGWGTGKVLVDEYFEQNARGAADAGIPFGVYFYSQAINKSEAREEAQLVIDYLEDYDVTFPVVYDIESGNAAGRLSDLSSKQITDNAIVFCEAVEKAGYRPMIYTYTTWFLTRMDMTRLEKYDKWLAQYYKRPFFPYQMRIWQYTSKGRVDGIKGNVDMNLCFYDYIS